MPVASPAAPRTLPAPERSSDRRSVGIAGALLFAAVALVYANSLSGPFVYDDKTSVIYNGSIRHLWPLTNIFHPPGNGATVSGRPVLNLTFALDYAWGGLRVTGYHVTNVLIHALAALTLFGLIRRTLLRPVFSPRLREVATPAAFLVAALWALHPLNTEAVTYIAQRAESLMSLFYLLTLYCAARGLECDVAGVGNPGPASPTPATTESSEASVEDRGEVAAVVPTATPTDGRRDDGRYLNQPDRDFGLRPPAILSPSLPRPSFPSSSAWRWGAFLACLAGMATKENMVSAPILAFLYDRAFVAGSFAAAWRARRWFYLALAATWFPLFVLVLSTGGDRGGSAGLDVGVTFSSYALTQFPALLHYARLAFWPHPLVFDYGAFFISHFSEVFVPAVLVFSALFAAVYAFFRRPMLGFLAALGLAILAPTSLVPGTTQMIVEHRMYLPLAALLCLFLPLAAVPQRKLLACAVIAAAVALGVATAVRNRVYRSELSLWADTVAKRPASAMAHSSYGAALRDVGRTAEAIAEDRRTLALRPDFVPALANLGIALTESGRAAEALPLLVRAVHRDPRNPNAHLNLGVTLDVLHREPEALPEYAEAVRLNPLLDAAHNDYGDALARAGKLDEGIAHLRQALTLNPQYAEAYFNLAAALVRKGDLAGGQATFAQGAELRPNDASAYTTWAGFLLGHGHPEEAFAAYRAAVQVQPEAADAHYSFGTALAGAQRYAEAVAEFQAAIKARPDYAEAYNNLGNTLSAIDRLPEAITAYEKAAQLRPADAGTHNNLGLALARSGRMREAADQFATAVRLAPDFANARANLEHAQAELGR